ncbi:aldolase [Skermanella stibiiresistens SB22]|uniref:Aldolase n=1 Tax=Skermanella stibiiresistens SB22 TaxID=1385369 RepID=W9H6A7_9PROT|nr:HPr kinase/phosphatase C-terminal domain-containing protein [Skermanella stibiiresistens]EWY40222.1 aldolase [Skermanella stibiiresistens SB22]
MLTIHGTCVALSGFGVLLRGPPGSGKSDLALRLIDGGARLVADDQIELTLDAAGRVMARAPKTLAGLLEVRGVGILPMDAARTAPIGLVVDLAPDDKVERLPEIETSALLDRPIRRLTLSPFHASTPAKLRLAAARLAGGALHPVPERP